MTGGGDAAREVRVRQKVRHRVAVMRWRALIDGQPSPWTSRAVRDAVEETAVARMLATPVEQSKASDPR